MYTKFTHALITGRNLSLALLLASGLCAFGAPVRTADGSLGLVTTEYVCSGGLRVTLIPTLHFAEADFYDAVERLSASADKVIYEGVRPAGFFGPPFEDDPRPNAPTDPRQITAARLRTLSAYIDTFRKINRRDPQDLIEVVRPFVAPGAADAFAQHILVDYWGTPLLMKTRASGQLIVMSRGADRLPGGDDFGLPLPLFDPQTAPQSGPAASESDLARGIDDYQGLGRAMSLSLQAEHPFPSQWRPSSLNADISQDMVPADLSLRTALPLAALAKVERPTHVALVYGAAHEVELDQALTGPRFSCRPSKTETLITIRADGPSAALRAHTIADILDHVK